ncbi:MAG: DUF4153 domain-containing protein [Bacteroidales bacterium]|nr:DUF4153 domain-containing protein [Bacteroidales bacterium]
MVSAIQEALRHSSKAVSRTFHERPVECTLLTILTLCDTVASEAFDGLLYQSSMLVIPVLFFAAFIANALIPQDNGWRRVYELIIPLTIIALIGGMDEKFVNFNKTTEYYTIIFLLSTGCLIVKHFNTDLDFIINMASLGWAALRSFLITLTAAIALFIISMTVENIFEVSIGKYLFGIPWKFIFPMLMLAFYDHTPQIDTIQSPYANGILNYVLTLAIITFMIILYAYILKIMFTWELPHGGIVRMTYLFYFTSMAASSLYRLAMNNVFNSFYHWMPTLSIPIVILFWVAAIRRVYDFGFTEARVYMVMIGILNLIFMFMLVFDRKRAYKSMITHAMGFAFVLGLIPPISAKNIASNLQWTNAESTITEEMLAENEDNNAISSYKFIQNNDKPLDIEGYRQVVFPQATISGDTITLETRNEVILKTSYENLIRRMAHQNDMTYDDFLGLAYTGYGTATLSVEVDSMYILFRRIVFNDYEDKAVVSAVFIK